MATSGSNTFTAATWLNLVFNWSQTSQNIANNTTTISWSLVAKTNENGSLYLSNRKWTVVIDGTTYTGIVNINLNKSSSQTLASGSHTITHNSDGKKTFVYSVTQVFDITLNSGKYLGTGSGSGTGVLNTIPRKSSMTATSGELAKEQTLTVTKAATGFTHTITYKCGTASGTVCDKSSSTSIKWTPSIELASQNTTGTSVTVTFTITTYSGSTAVGSSTASATYSIPSSVIAPVACTTTDKTGNADYYGKYVQGLSRLKIVINTYGVYGAWIKSYKVQVDGKTYTKGAVDGNTITVETETLTGNGTLPVVVTVTDSRNRVTVDSYSIEVLKHASPIISSLSAFRSDADGNSSPSGGYITVKFSSSISDLNGKNGAWYKVLYKKPSEANYTTVSLTNYEGNLVVTNGKYTFAAGSTSYDIVLKVGDRIITSSKATSGSSLAKLWSLLKSGEKIVGAALGKIAELSGVFDIAYQTKFSGGLLHPVLPTNSDLDAELTPKTYMLPSDNTYVNAPESGVGMFLEVVGSKGDIITQRISVFSKQKPRTYERSYYFGEWGEWIYTGADFVVEQGEKDGWTYRKWNRGTAECWKTLTHKTTINTAWGALYHGTATTRQSYPFSFVDKPMEQVSLTAGSYQAILFPEKEGNGVNGASASACYNVCRPSAMTTAIEFYISFYVTGKWK